MKTYLTLAHKIIKPILNPKKLLLIFKYVKFIKDYSNYKKLGGNLRALDIYPCLGDDTGTTGFDAQYLYQSIWAFKMIREIAPETHVDVGSDLRFVGPLTTLVNVEFIDIRPAQLQIDSFDGKAGSVTQLPYQDNSLYSLSCLHVIEHIGLGRYGDPLDPQGPEKAFTELSRVVCKNGFCLVSVPIGPRKIEFNAHRIFSTNEIQTLTKDLAITNIAAVDESGNFLDNLTIDQIQSLEDRTISSFLGMFVLKKL